MLYAILCEDAPNSAKTRAEHRPAHLERLKALLDQGRLELAGPHPAIDAEDPGTAGVTGSLIMAEFGSLEDAQSWAEADPFILAGVYEKVTVKPFKKVLPA